MNDIMPNVVILNIVMQNVVILNVIMLSVVILNVIMLSVVLPFLKTFSPFYQGSVGNFQNGQPQLRHRSPDSDALVVDRKRKPSPPARPDSGRDPARRPDLRPDVENGFLQPDR
jgi:hypothetical protein